MNLSRTETALPAEYAVMLWMRENKPMLAEVVAEHVEAAVKAFTLQN
jgi:hypothetical protein